MAKFLKGVLVLQLSGRANAKAGGIRKKAGMYYKDLEKLKLIHKNNDLIIYSLTM